MSKRKLKPEEKELWQQVAQTATPLFGAKIRPLLADKKPKQKPLKTLQLQQITQFGICSNLGCAEDGCVLLISISYNGGTSSISNSLI